MDTDKERESLLVYVRSLLNQEANDAKVSGINTWVLLAALAVLLNELLSSWATIRENSDLRPLFVATAGFAMIFLITAATSLIVASGVRGKLLELRLTPQRAEGPIRAFLLAALVTLPPAAFLVAIRPYVGFLEQNHYVELVLVYWTVIVTGITGFVVAISDFVHFESAGLPSLPGGGDRSKWPSLVAVAFLALNAVAASRLLLEILDLIEGKHWANAVKFAALVALLFVIIFVLFGMSYGVSRRRALEGLERDLVLGAGTNEELRKRLEYSIVGRALGGWIADQIQEVRLEADVVQQKCRGLAQTVDELIKRESEAQTEDLLDELEKIIDQLAESSGRYVSINTRFVKWISAARLHLAMDSELLRLVSMTTDELVKLSVAVQEEHDTLIARIREVTDRLKTRIA